MRYILAFLSLGGILYDAGRGLADEQAQAARFESQIRPLLAEKCLSCHSAAEQKGGLSLESGAGLHRGGESGPAVVAGSPDTSLLIEAIRQTGNIKMPPDERLSDDEIALVSAWVQDGAFWPKQRVSVPLGNLFDDPADTTLADAIASDEFKAVAEPYDLGVERVVQGWSGPVLACPSVRIDLGMIGADGRRHGAIVNDARDNSGGLRTKGESTSGELARAENGIGMHANSLITFDLNEIRAAGELDPAQEFTFRADRAGLNDDVFGNATCSAHLLVLAVRITADGAPLVEAYLNGRAHPVQLADGVWKLAEPVGPPLTANGQFATFEVPLPADARYLVLAATGANNPKDNSINSDHTVLAEARLEFLTDGAGLAPAKNARPAFAISDEQRSFWAFQPIGHPSPPVVADQTWPRGTIDRFVLAQLEQHALSPSPPAEKRLLVRRLAFDLTGLPPSPQDLAICDSADFEADYAALVDRLLASPHFGERWARHWLDVARYGEDQAHTFAARAYPNGYLYRDWVAQSLNNDLPFDQFVLQQIAGDLLPDSASSHQLAALGYFSLGPVYYADAGCAAKAALDELDDRVDTLAAGFLGLTVACARCHDHKFDPISQQDYYALAGIFASSNYREAPLVPQETVDQFEQGQAAIRQADEKVNKHLDAEGRKMAEIFARQSAAILTAAWKIAHPPGDAPSSYRADVCRQSMLPEYLVERWQAWLIPDNRSKSPALEKFFDLLARNDLPAAAVNQPAPPAVVEAAAEIQTALVAALDERDKIEQAHQAALSAAAEPDNAKVSRPPLEKVHAELLAALLEGNGPLAIPRDRVESLLDDAGKSALTAVRAELEAARKAAPPKFLFAHSLTEGNAADMKLHIRGSPTQTGAEVPRRFLEILSPVESSRFSSGSGRLDLARAIASPDNPLTARVIVNRVWQHYFGRGIVATPSNFGQMGERPSHPQLLDYLANQLIAQGWSLKALHREVLLSATYRQSSTFDGPKYERDPDNVWLWRMSRRRLDAESWRDAMLAASGSLDATVGGPSGNLADQNFKRRTLYGKVSRHSLDGMLRLFDFPDPNISNAARSLTTVPLQQLFVLNSEFMIARSRELAARLQQEAADDAGRVRQAYLLLYGRQATPEEVEWACEFLQAVDEPSEAKSQLSRWEQYAQVLLAANEFAYID
ncbi:MAG: DUF1553 domain-containing protein [Pirellulales bacterium]